jgi:hypothetical protein
MCDGQCSAPGECDGSEEGCRISALSGQRQMPRSRCVPSPHTRSAPSPLVGEGWGGGDAAR